MSATAFGADISAQLNRARTAAKAADHATAIAALQDALDAVRTEAPLSMEPFVIVSRPAALFGDIMPRKGASFAGTDELLFYMEPKNLVYKKDAGGAYAPGFDIDLEVIDAEGDVVASKKKFGSFKFASKSRLQDIYVNLTVTLNGAPAGDYKVRFTVRDINSDKVVQVEKPITMQ
jgi:hypothetical protein